MAKAQMRFTADVFLSGLDLDQHFLSLIGKGRNRKPEMVEMVKGSVIEALQRWHKYILPQHFGRGASRKYPGMYTPRTLRYCQRKVRSRKPSVQKAVGGIAAFEGRYTAPMTYTGEFKRIILNGSASYHPAQGQRSLKVKMKLPHARAANLWKGTSGKGSHDFHRELTAMNSADIRAIYNWITEDIDQKLNQHMQAG